MSTIFRRLCHYIGCENANEYFLKALEIAKSMNYYPPDEADWMARTLWNHGVEVSLHVRRDNSVLLQIRGVICEPTWYFESAIEFAKYADGKLQIRLQELYNQYTGGGSNTKLSMTTN